MDFEDEIQIAQDITSVFHPEHEISVGQFGPPVLDTSKKSQEMLPNVQSTQSDETIFQSDTEKDLHLLSPSMVTERYVFWNATNCLVLKKLPLFKSGCNAVWNQFRGCLLSKHPDRILFIKTPGESIFKWHSICGNLTSHFQCVGIFVFCWASECSGP